MKVSSIATIVASFVLVCGGALPFVASKMAVARTFSAKDADKLSASFNVWKELPPCDGNPSYDVDLVLVYSQSPDNSTLDAMEAVSKVYQETNGFGNCFDRLLALWCEIEPSQDIYRVTEASINPLWVNGPNRQFERTVRSMQANDNDNFYLMEMDSVPVRSFWLDALVEEIDGRSADFAILGSIYRGYKWDAFYSELPAPLRKHINGNAVYNTSHPVFERLVMALEKEANTAGNTVAYDYRLAQIIHESKTGEQAEFQFSSLDRPSKYSSLFADVEVNWTEVVRETPLIGNFAGTNVVPDYLGSDVVIAHGAKMFEKWNSTVMGNISLIVSDFSPSNVEVLLKSLEASSHPFSEVVVMVPEGTQNASSIVVGGTPIRTVTREMYASMDICTAPINTRWAMKTNSFFQLRQSVPLLVQDGKPVVTFSEPTKETCFDHEVCVQDLEHARRISPEFNRLFDDLDMVYDIDFRDEYCSNVTASGHGSPSATEYMSYLEVTESDQSVYAFSERRMGGLLSPFLRLSSQQVPGELKQAYQRRLEDSTNSTGSNATCTEFATQVECTVSGCTWMVGTNTCRADPDLLTEQQQPRSGTSTRPKFLTALISISIVGASIAFIALLVVAYKKHFGGSDVGDSVQPLDGSRDPQNQQGGADDEVDSSLLLASDFDYSKAGASFEEVDLDDGHFEETSGGVEFVQD